MLREEIERFLESSGKRDKTKKTYRYSLKRFVEIVGDDALLDTNTYIKFLKAIKKLSPSSQNVYRTSVLKLYAFTGNGDMLELKKATEHYSKAPEKRIVNFNRDALEKVIAHCISLEGDLLCLRDRAFVLTLADTGLRIFEACSLKRGDIDWQERRAVVIGKRGKQAVVHFSNRSIEALQKYLSARATLDGATGKPLKSLPIFSTHWSDDISPIQSGSMWKAIKDRIEEAGVPKEDVRLHDFRHYFVSTVYMTTRNIKVTKELARHEQIATTDRYTHLTDELGEAYDDVFNK